MSKSRRKQVEIVDVTFRSPHQELSESEKAYVRRKLQKLARFFHKLWALEVTYELVRGQHRVRAGGRRRAEVPPRRDGA